MQKLIDEAVALLSAELGDNLFSCCVYGSAVRGNAIEGVSDLNLLIVLHESNSTAHEALARVMGRLPKIEPFILSKPGLARSLRAFAPKFASIKRHYRVLHGADPLSAAHIDPELEKFLCEQILRNLRLRLVHSFVTRQRHKAYDIFVTRSITPLFVQVSEVLRLNGLTIPNEFEARIPVMEREFGISGKTLSDLLALKKAPRRLSDQEVQELHASLFPLVDTVLVWIESHWPA